jgi:two-component system, LytTR family, response regulator
VRSLNRDGVVKAIRTIIADDEPLARERVRVFLEEEPDIEIVAECADGATTVQAIEQQRPDLLFLDVQMPRLTGFEVLEALDEKSVPVVIFTTAHDQHAIRAFEVNAVDYLLKPFKQARFRKALQRARAQLQTTSQTAGGGLDPQLVSLLASWRGANQGAGRILVKSPDRILFLKPGEVDYIEADGNYVQLHVGKERHMLRETMSAIEARLSPAGFMRVSRSIIVNLSRIREVKPLGAGEYYIILQTGARLDMSCPFRELQERLDRA